MARTADYAIKGYLYQFHKTLCEILNSDEDSIITVEGIVEDIDIESLDGIKAIQCKYHEASLTFNLSSIYKPVLQMMDHYRKNSQANIEYILFAYFPSVDLESPPNISVNEFKTILKTEDTKLKIIAGRVKNQIKLEEFHARFTLEFGISFDALVEVAKNLLDDEEVSQPEIDTLYYPNALQNIAELSIKHNSADRKTTKRLFLENLKSIRKTAISSWTMALQSKKKLLDARRKQLKNNLNTNTRLRYFVLNAKSLKDFDLNIVILIHDYIAKYHFKQTHIFTPIFCIQMPKDSFDELNVRLYKKGIIATDGFIGKEFTNEYFFRDPLVHKPTSKPLQREFHLRLLHWDCGCDLLNSRKCEDLFVIGDVDTSSFDMKDINVEKFSIHNLQEIRYVMGISENYE